MKSGSRLIRFLKIRPSPLSQRNSSDLSAVSTSPSSCQTVVASGTGHALRRHPAELGEVRCPRPGRIEQLDLGRVGRDRLAVVDERDVVDPTALEHDRAMHAAIVDGDARLTLQDRRPSTSAAADVGLPAPALAPAPARRRPARDASPLGAGRTTASPTAASGWSAAAARAAAPPRASAASRRTPGSSRMMPTEKTMARMRFFWSVMRADRSVPGRLDVDG